MSKKIRTLISILLIMVIPILLFVVLFYGIKVIDGICDRYPESKKKYQEEIILKLCDENNILQINNKIYGDIFFIENDVTKDYQTFRILETPFSERFEIKYSSGTVTETYGYNEDVKTYSSNYKDIEEYIKSLYSVEINLSNIEVDIDFKESILKKQEKIIVKCKLNENSFKINIENEEIIFNDAELIYEYSLTDDKICSSFMINAYYDNVIYTIFVHNNQTN